MALRRTLMTGVALVLALAAPGRSARGAGVVLAFDGRLEGDVTLADGRVEVAGKAVPWDALIHVLVRPPARAFGGLGALHLAGGEVWRGEIAALAGKRLTIRTTFFGPREVAEDRITELEFLPSVAAEFRDHGSAWTEGEQHLASAGAAGTLYREKGEPVPGTLLWVDAERLAIDSPLGVLTLARDGAVRYLYPAGMRVLPGPAAGDDRVGLVDGSVLRGKARLVAGGVQVEHALLGTLKFGADLVHYVRRACDRVRDLLVATHGTVTELGIVSTGQPGGPRYLARGRDSGGATAECLEAMRLGVRTVLTHGLPEGPAWRQVRLMARVRPVAGARGDARLRVRAGDRTVLEKDFGPGAAPESLAVDLPAVREVSLECDVGPRIGLPAGVWLEDAVLVAAGQNQPPGLPAAASRRGGREPRP